MELEKVVQWTMGAMQPVVVAILFEKYGIPATTMEFADWVLSLEDQVDLNNSIAGSHYTTEPGQYYDSATHQWHPYGYGPAYQATPPVTTAPYVLTPHAIPTSAPTTAPPTAPPHVITPATLTPTAPAPVPPTAHAPAPPSASAMNSSPAAAKARPALPDPSQTTPTATAPTATAPTTTAATTTAATTTAAITIAATAPAHAPSTTPLTPAPPSYPPPNHGQAPWRATGTAQIAAIRKELNDALQELSQLKTEYTEQEAQLATEQHSYNQESAAFLQEMGMCHNEQSQYHECQSELRNFQRLSELMLSMRRLGQWSKIGRPGWGISHQSSATSWKRSMTHGYPLDPVQLPRISFSIAGTAASSVTSAWVAWTTNAAWTKWWKKKGNCRKKTPWG